MSSNSRGHGSLYAYKDPCPLEFEDISTAAPLGLADLIEARGPCTCLRDGIRMYENSML